MLPTPPGGAGSLDRFPSSGLWDSSCVVESVFESIFANVKTAAVPCLSVLEGFVAFWLPRPALQPLTRALVR